MKTFNEQTDLKLASLRRQAEQLHIQIAALETFRTAGKRGTTPHPKPTPKPKTNSKKSAPPTTSKKPK
jgi:hypothetical protein